MRKGVVLVCTLVLPFLMVGADSTSRPAGISDDSHRLDDQFPAEVRDWWLRHDYRQRLGPQETTLPATRPTTQASTAMTEGGNERRIEVTMLGPVDAVKGADWPVEADGTRAYSMWVTEPCHAVIHLEGRRIEVRTRPILILSQVNGRIMSIDAPPASVKASMREKVEEVIQILTDWGAQPNERMLETLWDWFKRDYAGGTPSRIVPDMRAGWASLGEGCVVAARFSSGSAGGWHIVMEFQATAEEWQRVRGSGERGASGAATQPASAPRPSD